MSPLEKLLGLSDEERSAFLAFFSGGNGMLQVARRGDTGQEIDPKFGKYECERVPFRETWQHKFPLLGLTTFKESEPIPALGMIAAGSTVTYVSIQVTDEGWDAREAFYGMNRPTSEIEP